MRSNTFPVALLALTVPWFTLGCASPPPSTNTPAPDPSVTPAGSPVALHGALRVNGTQLVDQNDAPIQLKGVSSQWLNYASGGFAESKSALAYMRDNWKLSVIRAAMGTDATGGYLGNPNGMQIKVEQIIRNAIELGVYVIVDWHTEDAVKPSANQQAKAVEFFGALAKKYAAHPNLIWETYNEPAGPGSARFTWDQIKPYHEAVVAAIREVDPDNLIVLGTPVYSQNVDQAALDPVIGSNLLYTLHFYACTHTEWLRTRGDKAIAAGLALFVTEFGATFADGGVSGSNHDYVCEDEANLWFSWMQTNNISGVAWKLDQCTDSSCILGGNASTNGPWTDDRLSTNVGGEVSGAGIKGGHGLFVVNWLRQ
jgi:endoglucanase